MKRFGLFERPQDEEDEDGGGGGATLEHDHLEPGAKDTKPQTNAEVEALRRENEQLKADSARSREDAEFWANRAKRTDPAPQPERREPEAKPVRERPKPEQLLDDMTTDGIDALRKHGVITQEDLDAAIEKAKGETRKEINETRGDAEFGLTINEEFPSMGEESQRIADAKAEGRTYRPTDPLFIRAGEIYRRSCRLDPKLADSHATLLIAARQARAELKSEGVELTPSKKGGDSMNDQQRRRQRIDRQTPERGTSRSEEGDNEPDLNAQQLEVMKHLKVKPEDYRKYAKIGLSGRGGR